MTIYAGVPERARLAAIKRGTASRKASLRSTLSRNCSASARTRKSPQYCAAAGRDYVEQNLQIKPVSWIFENWRYLSWGAAVLVAIASVWKTLHDYFVEGKQKPVHRFEAVARVVGFVLLVAVPFVPGWLQVASTMGGGAGVVGHDASPRRLSQPQKNQIANDFRNWGALGAVANVIAAPGDHANDLADDIAEALRDAGWKVYRPTITMVPAHTPPVVVTTTPETNVPLQVVASKIATYLRDGGLLVSPGAPHWEPPGGYSAVVIFVAQ